MRLIERIKLSIFEMICVSYYNVSKIDLTGFFYNLFDSDGTLCKRISKAALNTLKIALILIASAFVVNVILDFIRS